MTADQIAELAERVERLTPSRRDPERFFVERSEIASELRAAAQGLLGRERVLPGAGVPRGGRSPVSG